MLVIRLLLLIKISISFAFADNLISIDQVGNNADISIIQKGSDNQIKGTGTNTSAQVSGANTVLDINQGYDGGNLLQLNVDGDDNNIVVGQEKSYAITNLGPGWSDDTNSYGHHTATVGVTGSYNDVQIIQRNNNASSAGHTSSAIITNGDNNSVTTLQTGTANANGHNSYVHIKDGRDGNTVDIFQNSDTADHKAVVSVYSNNNNIDINQTGTTQNKSYVLFSHNSTGPTNFSLTQNGGDTYGNPDTGQYSTITCGNAAGCSVSVSQ